MPRTDGPGEAGLNTQTSTGRPHRLGRGLLPWRLDRGRCWPYLVRLMSCRALVLVSLVGLSALVACGGDDTAGGGAGQGGTTAQGGHGGSGGAGAGGSGAAGGQGGQGAQAGQGGSGAQGGAGGQGGGAPTYCAAELEAELAPIIEGLLYMSESDYPFDPYVVADAASGPILSARMLDLLGLPPATVIEQRSYDEFFTPYVLAQDPRFGQMRSVLEAHLTDTVVFRVGEIHIDVYVVGRTACGEVAGLHTVAIET